MKNALWKDIFRDIKKSKGRFISILAIIALGVMLFTGVKVSPIVMKTTADKYYDDYNLMDLRIVSTLGLTDDDVNDIRNIEGVSGVYPSNTIDAVSKVDSDEFVIRIHSMPDNNLTESNSEYINRLNVIEGRLPEKAGECVVSKEKLSSIKLKVGDIIKLKSGTDEAITDSLTTDTYEVVGLVETPFYLNNQIGSTTIGSGSVKTFMYIQDSNFKSDVYSDIYVTVNDTKNLNSYKDEYFSVVDKVHEAIDNKSDAIIERRYDDVISLANEELDKGKKEYEDKKAEIYQKLNDAEVEIANSRIQLANAEEEINNNELLLNSSIADGEAQLDAAEAELKDKEYEYEQGLRAFNEAKKLSDEAFTKADEIISEAENQLIPLVDRKNQIEEMLKDENTSDETKEQLQVELDGLNSLINIANEQISSAKEGIEKTKEQLVVQEATLNSAREQLDAAKYTISTKRDELLAAKNDGASQIATARAEVESGKNKLTEGEEEFRKNKILAEEELLKAEEKIKDAENKISKIEKPSLYILDRTSHYSYVDYESAANSIDKLSNVFPVFFVLVAALVCLTTMTRMVDEQRVNIGTLKALGYSGGSIAKKFIVYGLSASLVGAVIGLVGGFTILPLIIFNAYNIMYIMPKMTFVIEPYLAILSVLASILLTTGAAYAACRIELREAPAVLMRPKAPKEGKRILLERIPFIWNRFNFTGKVTLRNIFRYKKRFLMTVIGIAGSTALLLTGFGIKDSIKTVVSKQFGVINKYDISVSLDKNINDVQREELEKYLIEKDDVKDYILVDSESCKISANDVEKDVELIVPSPKKKFDYFIQLQERVGQKQVDLPSDGIAITEKAAKVLGVKVGDEISIVNSNDISATVKVSAIVENYINHYIYMDPEYYENTFDRVVKTNKAFVILDHSSDEKINAVSNELINVDGVSGVVNNAGIKDNFSNTIQSLDFVVLVMILCAGALSFIVLYNLTNVNISERIREIATIKVLGFYDKEVSAYIYRENILLTVIGLVSGLLLGIVFHRFIMVTVEMEYVMFGRNINGLSFVYAALLTMLFSFLVNWAMYYKLKNVEMVESLKSVD